MGKLILIFLVFLSSKLIAEDREWIFIDSVKVGDSMMKIRGEFIVVDSLDNKYIFEVNTDEINTNIDKQSYIFIFDNNKLDTVSYEKKYNFITTPGVVPVVDNDNSIWWISEYISNNKVDRFFVKLKDKKIEILRMKDYEKNIELSYDFIVDRNSIKHWCVYNDYLLSFDTNKKKIIKVDSSITNILNDSLTFDESRNDCNIFLNNDNSLSLINTRAYYQNTHFLLRLFSLDRTDSTWKLITKKVFGRHWGPVTYSYYNDQIFAISYSTLQNERKKLFYHFDKEWKEYEINEIIPHTNTNLRGFDNEDNFWVLSNGSDLLKIKDGKFDYIPKALPDGFIYPNGLNSVRFMKFDNQNNLWCLGNTLRNDSVLFVWAKNGNIYSKKDENKEISHLRLSPNPVSEKLTLINIPDNATEYEIYDQFGNRQISGLISGQIDVSLLPAGVYFIKLNNSQRPHKFLKI